LSTDIHGVLEKERGAEKKEGKKNNKEKKDINM